MAVGETKNVHIPADQAYGPRDESLIQRVPADTIPNVEQLPVGQTVYFQGPMGQPIPAKVVSIEDGVATFDLNHEMAGKDLNFEITLVEIED